MPVRLFNLPELPITITSFLREAMRKTARFDFQFEARDSDVSDEVCLFFGLLF